MKTEAKTSFTFEDYAQLPEGAPYQLIQGELVMSPVPSTFHQIIVKNLVVVLDAYVRPRGLGLVLMAPVDVYFSDDNAFQPDVVFVAADRLSIVGDRHIDGAPDLVIEVLSPSTAYYDLRQKKRVYAEHGVAEYWVIDPIERSVELFAAGEAGLVQFAQFDSEGSITSRVVPGFSIEWAGIFDKGL